MMAKAFERTFTVAVPVERAWRAFADGDERSCWEASTYEIDPRPGGRVHWTIDGGIESSGEVLEAVPCEVLRHVEGSGPHANAEVSVRFESVDAGSTRITITHAGFGESADWDEWLEGTANGWRQAIFDLVAYLTTGVPARRFATVMHSPGMTMTDTDAGVVVQDVSERGLAREAGLSPGDLLLRIGGVPVFTISDVWVLMRLHAPGVQLAVEYVRGGASGEGVGVLAGGWDIPDERTVRGREEALRDG